MILKHLILVLFASVSATVVAQETYIGRILDETTGEPLPFAAIGVLNSSRGAITNEDGAFQLTNINPGDTLVFRHLGYASRQIPALNFPRDGAILLAKTAYDIPAFTVFADTDELYDWLVECRKALRRTGQTTCRAYMELYTNAGGVPAEVIEMYYNASVESGSLKDLAFKNGRQSLAKVDNSYFLSLSMSRVFQIFNLTFPERHLPINPLNQTKSKLKSHFEVSRLSPDSATDIHIAFRPKPEIDGAFSGDIWISRELGLPLQVTLEIDSSKIHPFVPMFEHDSISDISMKITQRFRIEDDEPVPELLRFGYSLVSHRPIPAHLDPQGLLPPKKKDIQTEGLLYYYDYGSPFILPFFDFPSGFNDYQRIQNSPHNALFWRHNQLFVESERDEEREAFFRKHGIFRENKMKSENYFFEQTNQLWSRYSRLRFSNQPIARSKDYGYSKAGVTRRSQYNLHMQLYLDLVETPDGWRFESKTVMDAFRSYFDLHTDSLTDPFINIYFDLAEIQRRKMESELMSVEELSPETAKEIHQKHMDELDRTLENYERDTGSGQWISELKKWNKIVEDELELDNFKIFELRIN